MSAKVSKDIIILGIEASCDDTSIAISRNNQILANIVANQEVHNKFGGVVPELASREHQKNIIPTISLAIQESGITMKDIDGIAFTKGPGLMGSLLVGSSFAKSLAIALKKPLISINHMEAHVLANLIDHNPTFPFICLTVSGGHTQIVIVKDINDIKSAAVAGFSGIAVGSMFVYHGSTKGVLINYPSQDVLNQELI